MSLLRCPKFLRCLTADAENFDRGHSLTSLLLPLAALSSLPTSSRPTTGFCRARVPCRECGTRPPGRTEASAPTECNKKCGRYRAGRCGERTERCQWQKQRSERVAAVKISSVRRKAAQKFWAPQQDHRPLRIFFYFLRRFYGYLDSTGAGVL